MTGRSLSGDVRPRSNDFGRDAHEHKMTFPPARLRARQVYGPRPRRPGDRAPVRGPITVPTVRKETPRPESGRGVRGHVRQQ